MAQCSSYKCDTVSVSSMSEKPGLKKFRKRLTTFWKSAFSRKPKKRHPTCADDAAERNAAASATKKVGAFEKFCKCTSNKNTQTNPCADLSLDKALISEKNIPEAEQDRRTEDVSVSSLSTSVFSNSSQEENIAETEQDNGSSVSSCSTSESSDSTDSVCSWYSCVSSLKLNDNIPDAEYDSDTESVCSWYSCVSSLKLNDNIPDAEHDSDTDSVCSWCSCSSSQTVEDIPSPKQKDEIQLLKPNKGDFRQHYEIGKFLGVGSYGYVIDATRLSDSRKVAVKILLKKSTPLVKSGPFGELVPREVAMMFIMNKGSNVPEIINLLDWYETADKYMLVLERPMPCEDMAAFLRKQNNKLDESVVRAVMRQVVSAAKICIDRGVYHQDLKLQNLLINPDTLQVKLIDFSVSEPVKKSGYKKFNGTLNYGAPECWRGITHHAEPSTVFSLGVLQFKMLTGKFPYLNIRRAVFSTWEFSKESKDLIRSCLHTDPNQRIALEKILLHDWFQGQNLD